MTVRRPAKPRGRTECGILQEQCRTHRTTDSASMPALATLSLLSTGVSGLVQTAGLVVDALHSIKSSSIVHAKSKGTKSNPQQTIDGSPLANVFAACLTAASHSAGIPLTISVTSGSGTQPAAVSGTAGQAPTNKLALQQSQGTKNATGKGKPTSLAPLAAILATGPTTALTAARALHSTPPSVKTPTSAATPGVAVSRTGVPTNVSTIPTPATGTGGRLAAAFLKSPTSSEGGGTPGVAAPSPATTQSSVHPTAVVSKTVPSADLTNRTLPVRTVQPTPALPISVGAAATAVKVPSPTEKHLPATVANSSSPSNVAQQSAAAGKSQSPEHSTGGLAAVRPSLDRASLLQRTLEGVTPPSLEVSPASNVQTTSEAPVIALHDVPVSSVQDVLQPTGIVKAQQKAAEPATTERPSAREASDDDRSPTEDSHQTTVAGHSGVEGSHQLKELDRTIVGTPALAAGASMKFARWVMPTRFSDGPLAEGPAHSKSGEDAQQPSSTSPATPPPPVIAVGAANPSGGNPVAGGTNPVPSNVPASDQLSQAFLAQAAAVNHMGRTDFHLHLEPPQLGRVHVHLTATDQTVSARVVVSQEGTRQMILDQTHQLRQSLAGAGVVLGNFDVAHDGGGSFAGGRHQPPELVSAPAGARNKPASAAPVAVARSTSPITTGGINILA